MYGKTINKFNSEQFKDRISPDKKIKNAKKQKIKRDVSPHNMSEESQKFDKSVTKESKNVD